MAATLERKRDELTKPWVSESRTQADDEQPLRPELREIAAHLTAVRAKLAEAAGRDTTWRDEAQRLIHAFTVNTAADLWPTVHTTVQSGVNIDAALLGASEAFPANQFTFTVGRNLMTDVPESAWFGGLYQYIGHGNVHARNVLAHSPMLYPRLGVPNVEWYGADVTAPLEVIDDPAEYTMHVVPSVAPPVAVPRAPNRVHDGLRAFEDVKRWLDLSDEQTAEVAGLGRTTKYSWERGVVPRASTIRPLNALREALAGLVRSRGERYLGAWLNQVQSDGRTPLAGLLDGNNEGFIELLRGELFAPAAGRAPSEFRTFAPEPDVEAAATPRQLRRRPRRNRRRGDQ